MRSPMWHLGNAAIGAGTCLIIYLPTLLLLTRGLGSEWLGFGALVLGSAVAFTLTSLRSAVKPRAWLLPATLGVISFLGSVIVAAGTITYLLLNSGSDSLPGVTALYALASLVALPLLLLLLWLASRWAGARA